MTGMGNVGGNPQTQKFLSTSGVDEVRQWHGIYLAKVANTNDPLQQNRVTLHVPQVLGPSISNWAVSAFPLSAPPAVNSTVLASFLGGDINRPMYLLTPLTESVVHMGNVTVDGTLSNSAITTLNSEVTTLNSEVTTINGEITTINATLTSLQNQINSIFSGTVTLSSLVMTGNINMQGHNVNNIGSLGGNGSNIGMFNGLNMGSSNIDMQGNNINDIGTISPAGGSGNITVNGGLAMGGNINMGGNNINTIGSMGGNSANITVLNGMNMGGNNINLAGGNLNSVGSLGGNGGANVNMSTGINMGSSNIDMQGNSINDIAGLNPLLGNWTTSGGISVSGNINLNSHSLNSVAAVNCTSGHVYN